jgi:cation transport regulator ChaB
MATQYLAEQTISAVFKREDQIDRVVRKLLDHDIPQDHISVMGRDFQSQTRISGFVTKKDVILGGLRTGAVFGSLFGSFLSLLTGVGVLFIPFVGSVVAAGPISSLLLGAATGAIAGGAGAGLASALVSLGMPKEKATVYETRLQAGEFLLMVEVPSDRTSDITSLLEQEDGEEIHTTNMTLPRPCSGPCESADDLAPDVRSHLSEAAQKTFIEHYNRALEDGQDDDKAEQRAWSAVYERFDEDENGVWSKEKVAA